MEEWEDQSAMEPGKRWLFWAERMQSKCPEVGQLDILGEQKEGQCGSSLEREQEQQDERREGRQRPADVTKTWNFLYILNLMRPYWGILGKESKESGLDCKSLWLMCREQAE